MHPLHITTPIIRSESLSTIEKEVFLKLENLQPTGSFKIRGIGHLCQAACEGATKHFVSSSGGNAGLAAAYAAKKLHAQATVVVPKATSSWARKKIAEQNAEVIIHGDTWAQADDLAKKIVKEKNGVYVPPFDHPQIFLGNSSIVQEIYKQMKKPSAIVLSVGGGGLYSGVVKGLKDVDWNDVKIYACETQGAASFKAAFTAKHPVNIERVDTVAVTLGATKICAQAYEDSQTHPTIIKTVSDEQALRATINFANNHRFLVEPSCGASLSLLENDPQVQNEKRLLVIVCGGVGVTIDLLNQWSDLIGTSSN